ncbi:hypothetical protein BV898_02786 [Hypsibius exemplaris]|uniref:Uncharacterized protein n=1 Tax=Hypsibius exemplaris TaxID=2072580 RepID=A0A1W0X720_HYPEX|nr:hypothetical protein BV898_02786 [Hypsibius exemplaris]
MLSTCAKPIPWAYIHLRFGKIWTPAPRCDAFPVYCLAKWNPTGTQLANKSQEVLSGQDVELRKGTGADVQSSQLGPGQQGPRDREAHPTTGRSACTSSSTRQNKILLEIVRLPEDEDRLQRVRFNCSARWSDEVLGLACEVEAFSGPGTAAYPTLTWKFPLGNIH